MATNFMYIRTSINASNCRNEMSQVSTLSMMLNELFRINISEYRAFAVNFIKGPASKFS